MTNCSVEEYRELDVSRTRNQKRSDPIDLEVATKRMNSRGWTLYKAGMKSPYTVRLYFKRLK
jgi:hypothetical protein